MDLNRLPVKTIDISDKLVIKVSQTLEKDTLFLTILYMGGKFTLEKVFKNTLSGKENMDLAIKEYSQENVIKNHFGL